MTDNLLLDGHKVIYELMSSLTMLHFDGSRVVASCWRWSRYDEMKRELHEGASSLEVEECSCGGWGGACVSPQLGRNLRWKYACVTCIHIF